MKIIYFHKKGSTLACSMYEFILQREKISIVGRDNMMVFFSLRSLQWRLECFIAKHTQSWVKVDPVFILMSIYLQQA